MLDQDLLDQERDPHKFKRRIQKDVRVYFYYFPDLWAKYVSRRFDARSHRNELAFQRLQSQSGHCPPAPKRPVRATREPSPPYPTSEQPIQQTAPVACSPATYQEPPMSTKYEGPKKLMRSMWACIPKPDHQWGGTLRRDKMKGHPRTLASSRTSHYCSISNSESSDVIEGVSHFEDEEE